MIGSQFARSLRSRNYRLFLSGQAVSLIGLWMQYTAQAWLIYRLTDAAAMVGLVVFATQGPGLFLGPFAGAMADRHNKKLILILCALASLLTSAVLGTLTILGLITPWLVVAIAFVAGLARAVEVPTRQAFVPELVEMGDLPNAIALNSALFNVARLVGPAVAGLLIPLVGEGWCFLSNAVAGFAIVAALVAIRFKEKHVRKVSGLSLLREIRQGMGYVRREPTVRLLLGLLFGTSLLGMPYGVLLPSFAARTLGGGAKTYSQMQVAIGVGALTAALVLAARSRVDGLERWVIWSGTAFGFLVFLLSFAQNLAQAVPVLVLIGLCFLSQLASTNTLVQTICPGELRGRVMSLYTTIMLGVFPIAGLALGAVADRVGEPIVYRFCGLALAVLALLVGPSLRRFAPASLAALSSSSDI